jgi:uncharacterized protein YndB with AHSA1/START domain
MASALVTPDQDAVVSEIEIAAPPARVFRALVDPKQVMQWWTADDCQIEAFSFEPEVGGQWRYDTKQTALNINGVSKFHCEGEVLEYDPPWRLAYTWIANWNDKKSQRTVVRWELTPHAGGTRLKVTHSGLSQLPVARQDYSSGWPGVLVQVKNYVQEKS